MRDGGEDGVGVGVLACGDGVPAHIIVKGEGVTLVRAGDAISIGEGGISACGGVHEGGDGACLGVRPTLFGPGRRIEGGGVERGGAKEIAKMGGGVFGVVVVVVAVMVVAVAVVVGEEVGRLWGGVGGHVEVGVVADGGGVEGGVRDGAAAVVLEVLERGEGGERGEAAREARRCAAACAVGRRHGADVKVLRAQTGYIGRRRQTSANYATATAQPPHVASPVSASPASPRSPRPRTASQPARRLLFRVTRPAPPPAACACSTIPRTYGTYSIYISPSRALPITPRACISRPVARLYSSCSRSITCVPSPSLPRANRMASTAISSLQFPSPSLGDPYKTACPFSSSADASYNDPCSFISHVGTSVQFAYLSPPLHRNLHRAV